VNDDQPGQFVACGDSGGPDIAPFGPDDSPFDQVIGVHSTGAIPNVTVSSAIVTGWVQDELGGVYLTNDQTRQTVQVVGGAFNFVTAGSTSATAFKYDSTLSHITANSQCLGISAGAPRMVTCNNSDSTQSWNILWDRTIRNAQSGLCLTAASTTSVTASACKTFPRYDQYWAFKSQN
jgi:Ricin-type beta-trefoil lectin domain